VANGLVGPVAEQPLGGGVPGRDRVVEVGGNDGLGTHFQQRLEESLLAIELGDVVVDGERPDRFAVQDQRGGQQLDVNEAPILPGAPADGSDVLTGRHSLPELHRLCVENVSTGHQIVQVSSRGFLRRVPEESLRGGVPRRDTVAEVGEHDGRRTERQSEPRILELPRVNAQITIGCIKQFL